MGHYAGIFAGAVGRERIVNLIPLLTWLLNIYFRLSGFQAPLLLILFRYGRSEYLFTLHPGTQTMRYVTLNSVTETAPKSPFICVNRSPILHGFCTGACAKAIRYGVNTSDMFLHFKRSARRGIRAVMRNFAKTEAPGADLGEGCRGCAPPLRWPAVF